jgi:hypothetical protein
MTITGVETINYEEAASGQTSDEQVCISDLPKLVWAGLALVTINAVIGIGMLITPNMQIDMYGSEVHSVQAASSKPSPFQEVVDTKKHKVRLAAKVTPVTVDSTPLVDNAPFTVEPASTSLDIPRSSRAYQLDIPARTEPAIYRSNANSGSFRVFDSERSYATSGGTDAAGRPATVNGGNSMVIN